MTQFHQIRRVPRYSASQARMRRATSAFLPWGGGGGSNTTHVFTSKGYEVKGTGTGGVITVANTATGKTLVTIDEDGISAPDRNSLVLTVNTTLNATTFNQVVSCDHSANLKITLNAASNTFATGTWLGFQDVSGSAGQYNITVDPDTANTGFTINGGSDPVTIVDSDHGIGFIRLLKETGNTNLFAEKSVGPLGALGSLRSESTNTTVVFPESTILMNTAGGDRKVFLPDAANYYNSLVFVKKTDNGSNKIRINTQGGQQIDNIGTTVASNVGRRGFGFISDGSDWWIIAGSGSG